MKNYGQVRIGGGFIAGNSEPICIDEAKIYVALEGRTDDRLGPPRSEDGDGVEPRVVVERETRLHRTGGHDRCGGVCMHSNPVQAFGPVPTGVHAGHHGEQHLRGADIAGRFVSPDVLLASLQGEAKGGPSGRVYRDPNETTGKRPFVGISHRHEPGVGTPEPEWYTKPLGRTDHHIGPH